MKKEKMKSIKTKALVLAICVLFLAAMSAVCLASTTTYSVPIGTGAADFADNNLASAYTWEFATGYTGSVAEWSEDIRLTTDSADSKYPAIAVDTNNNVHITWYDYRDGTWSEIYYMKLDDNGNTLVDDTRLTTVSAYSKNPTIAVDTNNNVHITWEDSRDGNYEIYYKHSIASDTPPAVSIYTDKTSYTAGDTMRLGLDVKNPGSARSVCLDIYLDMPTGGTYTLLDTTGTLSAGLEYSKSNFKVITLPSISAGTYTWHAKLSDPVTDEIISEDTASWEFVSMGASIETEDIREVLEQAAVDIDFGE